MYKLINLIIIITVTEAIVWSGTFRFVIRRYMVRISAGTLAILIISFSPRQMSGYQLKLSCSCSPPHLHSNPLQWPRNLRHELPSLARTLGSWVRVPSKASLSVCVYSVFVLSCVGSGLVTGWSPVQGVLPTVLGSINWSETKRFTDALCSKVGNIRRERDRDRERESILSYWERHWINHKQEIILLIHYKYYVFGHYPSSCPFFKNHNVSETGSRLRPQVKPTQLDPTDRASP
jgi:hypothetical protein